MNRSIFLVLAAASLSALLFTGCNDSMEPIFYTISRERPIADGGLNNEISILDMTEAGGNYYVAAVSVFYRPTAPGSEWKEAPKPSGTMTTSIEEWGGAIYAAFKAKSGSAHPGIYQLIDPADPSAGWTNDLIDGAFKNCEVNLIQKAGSTLFIGVKQADGKHSLYGYDPPNPPTLLLADKTDFFVDVTYDSVLNCYFVITATELFRTGSGDLIFAAPDPYPAGIGASETLRGVYSSSAGPDVRVYLSTSGGKLFRYDGSVWSSVSETGVAFEKFIQWGSRIVVGTRIHGYYQFDDDGSFTGLSRQPNYYDALYDMAVKGFYVSNDGKLFACTYNDGLWRRDTEDANWARE